jgi:dolichol kinase
MFLVSALILFVTLNLSFHPQTAIFLIIWRGIIVASFACIAEAISGKGTDNLSIPAASAIALAIVNYV